MDIILTTPKSESKISREEACEEVADDPESYWFRTYSFNPKVKKGDKVFFTENGLITGFSKVLCVEELPEGYMVCDSTDRIWKGNYVMKFNTWTWIKEKIQMKGFRRIRYVEKLKDWKLKAMLSSY
ncbi:hypothetical protein LCGC14_1118230 [marine sediment metagenome]|uniref:Uncharacterized protein n=1 Tax=marine sediment metagenome TaxID=412755 RepID=A0A0F9QAK6_9ZZZZ